MTLWQSDLRALSLFFESGILGKGAGHAAMLHSMKPFA